MDPLIVKKGIEDIREQMRDMQREAHLIESDMEQRRQAAILKTQTQRYLPQSLTDEFDSFKVQMQEANLQERVNQVGQAFSGVNHTREVVMQRLGGAFDYTSFQEDLRLILVEKDALDRQFRLEALPIPEPVPTRGRLPDYDFSSSIFSKDLF